MTITATIRYVSPDRREEPPARRFTVYVSAEGYTAEEIAEAVYTAVDCPFALTEGSLPWYFQREVNVDREVFGPLWGLMVGDTITVSTGTTEATLRIAPVGWEATA
jgi:hypothetical protein